MTATAPEGLDELRRGYLDAQLAGDRRRALQLVVDEGLGRGHDALALVTRVVQAAQREIGAMWQMNRITIAQEHMATAISQVVMSRLFEAAPPAPRVGRKVVVACVEGEHHEFPARLVADFLEIGGFDIRYLGADVPLKDLLDLLKTECPDLLALSVTMSFNAPALRSAVERVAESSPDLPVLVGGHALAWEPGLAATFRVSTCEPDAASLVAMARRLTGLET